MHTALRIRDEKGKGGKGKGKAEAEAEPAPKPKFAKDPEHKMMPPLEGDPMMMDPQVASMKSAFFGMLLDL